MAKIKYEELEQLAFILKRKIEEEFSLKKLSGNLVNTIEIVGSADKIEISIPAPTYNMLLYQTRHVVVPTYHGSYASKIDKKGSEFFVYPYGTRKGSYKVTPHNHINFVDRVIKEAINEWMAFYSTKYKEKRRTDTGEQNEIH